MKKGKVKIILPDLLKGLESYFDIEGRLNDYAAYCKKCPKGWEIKLNKFSPGSALFLLNHGRSHLKEAKS